MAFLFKSSKGKSPQELGKALLSNLLKLDACLGTEPVPTSELSRLLEENTKTLLSIKSVISNAEDEDAFDEMCHEFYSNDLLFQLLSRIRIVEFETRKEIVAIFLHLLRRQIGTRFVTADFLNGDKRALQFLFTSYACGDIALHCGIMIRECCKFGSLVHALLDLESFWRIFEFIELPEFQLSSDAFATLRELLLRGKQVSAAFLAQHYALFIGHFNRLLQLENYVIKRQTLKLLGDLFKDRANSQILLQYVGEAENLKITMNALRDKSKSIQLEAFHIFKLFLFASTMSCAVREILENNQQRLISFVSNFCSDKLGT